MGEYLSFEKFVTPVAIKVIFWVGVVGIALFGLISMFTMSHFSALGPLGAIIGTVVGLFAWRVWCELVMLSFRIYEELVSIRKNTTR